jgi:hypothetical protein
MADPDAADAVDDVNTYRAFQRAGYAPARLTGRKAQALRPSPPKPHRSAPALTTTASVLARGCWIAQPPTNLLKANGQPAIEIWLAVTLAMGR